jgi:hypothetical protein
MFKKLDIGLTVLVIVLVSGFILLFCNSNQYTEPTPFEMSTTSEYTILVKEGECWVVTRDEMGLVTESFYHADKVLECVQWLREKFSEPVQED